MLRVILLCTAAFSSGSAVQQARNWLEAVAATTEDSHPDAVDEKSVALSRELQGGGRQLQSCSYYTANGYWGVYSYPGTPGAC
jgi:hypothetical protein